MSLELNYPALQSMTLSDGRRLAWYEFGNLAGTPCIYTTGTPASGLTGALYHQAALDAGVRFISVDKPGYGHSDFMPGRRLTDWPRDIAELADHLGLDKFAAMGESGGGPHVLALAWGIPERLSTTLTVAGMGPGHEAWVREGMKPMNRRLFWLAQKAPWLLRFALKSLIRTIKDPKRRDKWVTQQLAVAPPADRKVMEAEPNMLQLTLDASLGAFREGPRGAAQEMQIFGQPWGFALGDISAPVILWHGTEDVNVPVAVARRVAEEIPNCQARIIDGGGHALSVHHAPAMMQQILNPSDSPG